jgi:hypothetical protein
MIINLSIEYGFQSERKFVGYLRGSGGGGQRGCQWQAGAMELPAPYQYIDNDNEFMFKDGDRLI